MAVSILEGLEKFKAPSLLGAQMDAWEGLEGIGELTGGSQQLSKSETDMCFSSLFSYFGHAAWLAGSQFPNQGLKLGPQQ